MNASKSPSRHTAAAELATSSNGVSGQAKTTAGEPCAIAE